MIRLIHPRHGTRLLWPGGAARLAFSSLTLVAVLLGALPAHAAFTCTHPSPSDPSEREFFDKHGCDHVFAQEAAARGGTVEDDWGDKGFAEDDCSLDKEWGKYWNAQYLIRYGIGDSGFHSGFYDYWALDINYDNARHAEVRFQVAVDYPADRGAEWSERFGKVNLVRLFCPKFEPSQGDPASRAVSILHEMTHAWNDRRNLAPAQHPSCPGKPICDEFYPHRSPSPAGSLVNQAHSAIQMNVESFCDIAESSSTMVPKSLRDIASEKARYYNRTYLRNPVMNCGSPRPGG